MSCVHNAMIFFLFLSTFHFYAKRRTYYYYYFAFMFVVWAAMSVYLHFVITFDKTIWYFWLCFLFGAFRILCVPKYRVTFRVVPPLAHVLHKQHNLWVFDCCSFANIFLFFFRAEHSRIFLPILRRNRFPRSHFFSFVQFEFLHFFSIRFLCSVNFFLRLRPLKTKGNDSIWCDCIYFMCVLFTQKLMMMFCLLEFLSFVGLPLDDIERMGTTFATDWRAHIKQTEHV